MESLTLCAPHCSSNLNTPTSPSQTTELKLQKRSNSNGFKTVSVQFNDISRGRLLDASRAGARWVHHEMIGQEREVLLFTSLYNVGLVCDARGGSSLCQRER